MVSMKHTKQILALVLSVVVTPAFADPERRFGLDDLLKDAPEIAGNIHPSETRGLRQDELDTPARRDQNRGHQVREAAQEANLGPAIDWHAVTQEAFKMHAKKSSPPGQAVSEAVHEVLDLPTPPRSPQGRLLSHVDDDDRQPRAEKLPPTVSDLGAFRARAVQSQVAVPKPEDRDGMRRHDPFAGRGNAGNGNSGHYLGYTQGQGFTAP